MYSYIPKTPLLIFIVITTLASCTAADEVRIVRDDYGTPHIYADNIYGLYYGYGYSIAQDRLFQIEMARRSTQGKVAEVLGADYIEFDKQTRQLFDPSSIKRQLAGLDKKDYEIFAGYAAGINRWLSEIHQNKQSLLPKQFTDFGFLPSDWTAYDVAMIFIGTMNNRYGDFNSEIENAHILNSLVSLHGEINGRELFDLLNPRYTSSAPTTIRREEWSRPEVNAYVKKENQASLPLDVRTQPQYKSGFSYCYVLARDKVVGANSILVSGPQFGWFNPSYVYSVGLHGAGVDVAGNTPFGYPMIVLGHNDTISWGGTWGASDITDIYVETLNPENPLQYFFDGENINLQHRIETIHVRGSANVVLDVYRSVHGPIVSIDKDAGIAYSKKRSWEGRELETLIAWLYSTWAKDFDSWKTQIEKISLNVNMFYADVEGNIGFFHGGHFPERQPGHDNRFPVTGDGSMEWKGRQMPARANPYVFNPSIGYLANWNNKPANGVMNPDFFFLSWSAADRIDFLHAELSSRQKFTAEDAWAVIERGSYIDLNAAYILPIIDNAAMNGDNLLLKEANEILQEWNRQSRDLDENGFYDEAATAIFRTFVGNLIDYVLSDDLGDVYPYFSSTGYPTVDKPTNSSANVQSGIKAIVETLEGRSKFDVFNGEPIQDIVGKVLKKSLLQLNQEKEIRMQDLRLPVARRPYSTNNFLGIPQAGKDELVTSPIDQNRGTENNMIVMKPGAIVAWEVTPPGQNAFISPNGDKGDHYDDQLELYESFGRKRVWFYDIDVERNMQSQTILKY